MHTKLATLAIAAALVVGTAGVALAQAPWGYGFTPGYTSGWGAPPSMLPHPACSTYPDYGNSPACEVPAAPYYGYGYAPYGYGYAPGRGW